ncbi:DUF3247 family protein [Luteimonas deserti]|uniref:DUF3247 family protein n=1 Tax=Luteimonas deserti TaxID=2752306 RepID=A0A7Z0QUG3_9GAMM|nr:DUF3247 family protein [Luteimonas deserti]NYZ63250.1 DUF3247 family protein [Luteimonas deserti]
MSETAPQVYTDSADIERLKRLQLALDGESVVEVTFHDGRVVSGTIPERPTLQTFFDPDGREGTNGVFRLDHGQEDIAVRLFWLGDVTGVRRIDSR